MKKTSRSSERERRAEDERFLGFDPSKLLLQIGDSVLVLGLLLLLLLNLVFELPNLERSVLDLLLLVLDILGEVSKFLVERSESGLLRLEFGVGGVESGLGMEKRETSVESEGEGTLRGRKGTNGELSLFAFQSLELCSTSTKTRFGFLGLCSC